MAIQLDKIEALKAKMKEAPEVVKEKRQLSKQDAVKELKREIEGMQKKGYTLEDIAKFLTDGGLQITTPTLKSYMQRSKAETPKPKKQEVKKQDEKKAEVFAPAKKQDAPAAAPQNAAQPENKGKFVLKSEDGKI
jgi:DNA-binding transcriptional MerR regulator